MVTFEAFVGFLVQITEDTTSPDQVRESFRGIASDKVGAPLLPRINTPLTMSVLQAFVTELDLRHALVPQSAIDYLLEAMPRYQPPEKRDASAPLLSEPATSEEDENVFDYELFLEQLFEFDS